MKNILYIAQKLVHHIYSIGEKERFYMRFKNKKDGFKSENNLYCLGKDK